VQVGQEEVRQSGIWVTCVQGFRSAVGLVEVLKRSEKSGIWVTCVYGCCGWLRCGAVC